MAHRQHNSLIADHGVFCCEGFCLHLNFGCSNLGLPSMVHPFPQSDRILLPVAYYFFFHAYSLSVVSKPNTFAFLLLHLRCLRTAPFWACRCGRFGFHPGSISPKGQHTSFPRDSVIGYLWTLNLI